jgi:integrase
MDLRWAYFLALPIAEILALRWFRINFDNLTMVVKQAVASGGDAELRVIIETIG